MDARFRDDLNRSFRRGTSLVLTQGSRVVIPFRPLRNHIRSKPARRLRPEAASRNRLSRGCLSLSPAARPARAYVAEAGALGGSFGRGRAAHSFGRHHGDAGCRHHPSGGGS